MASNTNIKTISGVVYRSEYLDENIVDGVIIDKILVSIRTDNANMNLFTKFKAIVTEYGGVLSHAAIYSREFKIPCIVGVKEIMAHVKTGDKIELNLETGEVRKLC